MLTIVALCGVGPPVFAAQPELHTPPKGSSERQALMEALRDAYKTSRNRERKLNRGNITFHVYYLKVHNGWGWTYAEPHSSDPKDGFPENSGFLLQLKNRRWKVMNTPPMDADQDGNLVFPSRKDVEKIRKMYPSLPIDIFPNQR
jgi:hypothetical protein